MLRELLKTVPVLLALAAMPAVLPAQGDAASQQQPVDTGDHLPWSPIRDAVAKDTGKGLASYSYIRCTLVSIQSPQPGTRQPWKLFIADDTGQAPVVVFEDVWLQVPDREKFVKGAVIDLFAETGEYRGERQLNITQPTHIRVKPGFKVPRWSANRVDPNVFVPVTIGAIGLHTVDSRVQLAGVIEEYAPSPVPRTPTKITLRDQTGAVELVFWREVSDKLDPTVRLDRGMPLVVKGVVRTYRNQIQVNIEAPEHLANSATAFASGNGSGEGVPQ
ncbi:MAG: OB-fold nucleic acid binding domain-containing protein [Candidatus Sumerlaeia bacterium]|nr:OB-fold nucleic acid binding domain-containing protein [Candidatus Sumerlaeia bacterium]